MEYWNNSSSLTPSSGSTSVILTCHGRARAAGWAISCSLPCEQHRGWDSGGSWYSLLLSTISPRDTRRNAILSPGNAGSIIFWANLTFYLKYWCYCISTYQQNVSLGRISFSPTPKWGPASHMSQPPSPGPHSGISQLPVPTALPKGSSQSLSTPSGFNWNVLKAKSLSRRWVVLSAAFAWKEVAQVDKGHTVQGWGQLDLQSCLVVTFRQERHSNTWG